LLTYHNNYRYKNAENHWRRGLRVVVLFFFIFQAIPGNAQQDTSKDALKKRIKAMAEKTAMQKKQASEAEEEQERLVRAEEERKKEEARTRREEEALKRTESEVRKREKQSEEITNRLKRIGSYLRTARRSLKEGEIARARGYVEKVIDLDEENPETQKLMEEISRAEEKKEIKDEQMRQRSQKLKIRKENQKRERQLKAYLKTAREDLRKKNFSHAYEQTKKALEIEKDNREALKLFESIKKAQEDERERKGRSRKEDTARRIAEKRAAEKNKTRTESEKRATVKLPKDIEKKEQSQKEPEERPGKTSDTEKQARREIAKKLKVRMDKEKRAAEKARIEAEKEKRRIEKEQQRRLAEEKRAAEKARIEAEKEKRRIEKEQQRRLAEEKRAAGYLEKARGGLEENNLREASRYAKKALEADNDNEAAKKILAEIEKTEKTRKEKEESLRKEETALMRKRVEDIKKAKEEKRRIESASDYLKKARNYAEKALKKDKNNPDALKLLSDIEQSEKEQNENRERLKKEETTRKKAADEAIKRARMRSKEKKEAEKERSRREKEARIRLKEELMRRKKADAEAKSLKEKEGRERQRREKEVQEKRKAEAARAEKERVKERDEAGQREKLAAYNLEKARAYAKKAMEADADNIKVTEIDSKEQERPKLEPRLKEETAAQKRAKEEAEKKKRVAVKTTKQTKEAEKYLETARGFLAKIETREPDEYPKAEETEKRYVKTPGPTVPEPVAEPKKRTSGKRAEMMAEYLTQSVKHLNNNEFPAAREYAKRAFNMKKDSREVGRLLDQINLAEKTYMAEHEGAARISKKQQAIMDIRDKIPEKKVTEKEENPENIQKIAEFLAAAQDHLNNNRFNDARGFVKRALEVEKNNRGAWDLLAEIDRTQKNYGDGLSVQEQQEQEKKIIKTAAVAVREQVRKEEEKKRLNVKIGKNIARGREYLLKKDYRGARRYAYMAWEQIPHDNEVAVLIADIDSAEMFGIRHMEEKTRPKKIKKAFDETSKKDPFYEYDAEEGWGDSIIKALYKKKKIYRLDDVQEGREYTVDECVGRALRRSQRMVVADRQIALAEVRVLEARRALLPTLSAKYEPTTGKMGTSTGTRHYQGKRYQLDLKHTLFDGMGTFFKVRQAQSNLDIVKLEREKIKSEIIENTKKAYYNLDKTIKNLSLQEKFKDKVNSLYEIVAEIYRQELVSRAEYLKVKGQNVQMDFQYISAREDLSMAETMLFQAMNMESGEYISIKPVESPGKPISIGLENCYRLALANRADFKIKEKTIEYYDFERKMKRAKGWPKIDFQGSFGQGYEVWQPTEAEDEQRGLQPQWFAGAKASFPLWGNTLEYNYVREFWPPQVSSYRGTQSATSYFTIKFLDDIPYFTNLLEARVGFESSKYEYLKAKNDLMAGVKEVYHKYIKALRQIDVARAKVEHQRVFVNILEERRRFGEMETSRVIEEYEKLATDEYSVVQGATSYYIALAELNKATGLPDYFKPEYENSEYNEWKKEISGETPDEENIEEIT